MRIARVEASWVRIPIASAHQHRSDFGQVKTFDAAFVRVETDTGIVGWGEGKNAAGSAGDYASVVTLINKEIAPKIIGRDPLDIQPIWENLFSGVRYHHVVARGHVMPEMARRGVTMAAISAIDIALWDIAGKHYGEPLWRLLGGKRADRLPAYASGGWAPASEIGAQLKSYVDAGGFQAVKMRVGAMDGPAHISAGRVQAAREALGPGIEIMVDAHGTYTVGEAKRFCHLVRDCDLAWFEEPVTAEDKTGIAEVRSFTHIPIACGENESTRYDFRDLIVKRCADILQPDLASCGGISEARHIASLAASFNLRLAPHLWAGAPAFFAGLHVLAASHAGHIVEYSLGANPMIHDTIAEKVSVTDGMIVVPDRPGLGITVKEDVIGRFAVAV
jgi:L-alanine-DL-glutamate epimerase-like enolase superfamily enzyme